MNQSDRTILYGPYFNPSDEHRFYAITFSEAVFEGSDLNGVLNHDLNLNFTDDYDELFGLQSSENHYFVAKEGLPLFHSVVDIAEEDTTLVQAEFSQTNVSLDVEPDSTEVDDFKLDVLPIIEGSNSSLLSRFVK